MRNKPILCVDFDGVIHAYTTPWSDAETISDGAVPGALRWLWKATEWFNIHIYSSRSKSPEACRAMRAWLTEQANLEWPDDAEMVGLFLGAMTVAHEKPAAFLTIDDRAICFGGDWSELEPAELLNFKPWNKQPKLGSTGAYPDGKLHKGDEGELRFGVARGRDGLVHVDFGKDVSWLAMPPNDAKAFAALLMKHSAGGVSS